MKLGNVENPTPPGFNGLRPVRAARLGIYLGGTHGRSGSDAMAVSSTTPGSLVVKFGLGVASIFNPLALVPLAGKIFADMSREDVLRRQLTETGDALDAAYRWSEDGYVGLARALNAIRSSTETKYKNFVALLSRGLVASGIAPIIDWAKLCEAHLRGSQGHLADLFERSPEIREEVLAHQPGAELLATLNAPERSRLIHITPNTPTLSTSKSLLMTSEKRAPSVFRSLAELLAEDGVMSPERALPILLRICDALAAFHSSGAVHGDVKPDAILVGGSPQHQMFARLVHTDVGAKLRANPGLVLGTPRYMSPEQFTVQAGRPLDARSDIYSLGVVAYEMLTGRMPFQAETPWEWATQKLTSEPIPLVHGLGLPKALARAVMRALSRNPEERFASATEFASASS